MLNKRKTNTVTDDGHNMTMTDKDGFDSMISGSYDKASHYEVREDWRDKLLASGASKKTISTRTSTDNTKNFRKREMTNIGIVVDHGTIIDTSKASDGEFKNGRCVSARNDSELLSAKRERFVEMMMKLRK
jgi:hypothetical protein